MPIEPLQLRDLVAPAFTPMRADGSLDLDQVQRLADHARAHRIAGIFCGGTTGEGLSLSVPERQQLLERWVLAAGGRFPVMAHVGHAGIGDTLLLAAHATRAGAAAVATLPPFYFKPADVDDLVDYCAAVANRAPALPFYYYHIPGFTGVNLSMREFVESAFARIPTFAGLKFSGSDLADFGRCVTFATPKYDLYFGRDEMLLAALAVGATAAIGSTYNLIAPLYRRMIRAFENGDLPAARHLQARSREFISVMDRFGGLPAMKAAMAFAGVDCGPCRPPLRTLDASQRDMLRAELERETPGFFSFTRPEESEVR